MKLKNRSELPILLNRLELLGHGAEIGVQQGRFAQEILRGWLGEKLYLIDCWRQMPGYQDIANVDPNQQLNHLAHTFMNVYEFGARATIIREFSLEAVKLFANASLDFVYLDSDHSYEGVSADLQAWYPKIRPGGIFAGHDFLDGVNSCGVFGVASAVTEFAATIGRQIETTEEEDFPSWILRL